jgi:hypothetical protein
LQGVDLMPVEERIGRIVFPLELPSGVSHY